MTLDLLRAAIDEISRKGTELGHGDGRSLQREIFAAVEDVRRSGTNRVYISDFVCFTVIFVKLISRVNYVYEYMYYSGDHMLEAAQKFSDDPLDLTTRNLQNRAVRALLSSVTRLLVLADMVDVNRLLSISDRLHELFALFRDPSQTSNERSIGRVDIFH